QDPQAHRDPRAAGIIENRSRGPKDRCPDDDADNDANGVPQTELGGYRGLSHFNAQRVGRRGFTQRRHETGNYLPRLADFLVFFAVFAFLAAFFFFLAGLAFFFVFFFLAAASSSALLLCRISALCAR